MLGKAIYGGNTELEPIEVAKLFNQTKGLSEVKPSKDEPKEKVLSSGESSDAGKAEEAHALSRKCRWTMFSIY